MTVLVTATAGAAYLDPENGLADVNSAPAESYSQLGHAFGGGTAPLADLRPASVVSIAGSATVATFPWPST